ncbi:hypothetical protein KORDIASMS9_02652 [Kordia sp. SMS9]|uniref:hypothetical protein n=1 Tax=Kordia sp. SMS9 TaxID=2282170 RepID=UPI000E10E507|nr:hypothetical protein [Kordia sp. SMS9]AXG70412.1 hypothetical protein KORDIASMS9_02652 [Kordia sp. SMS9]
MKKRNLKALSLRKNAISNFSNSVTGKGTLNSDISCPIGTCIESITYCTYDTCGTCIVTHCEGGVVCNLTVPPGKY